MKLKPVFVESVAQNKSVSTIYREIFEKVKIPELNFDDIEDNFKDERAMQAATQATTGGDVPKKKAEAVCIVPDSKRAYNISIMINKFRKNTMAELRDALINFDPKLATPENCLSLMNFCPDADEITICKGYDGPLEELDSASQYLIAMSEVPRMQIRLRTLMFKAEFQEKIDSALNDVDLFKKGCQVLRDSDTFRSFLAIAVMIANALNNGTNRGNSFGLKPKSLLAFNNVKGNKGMTLLGYIFRKIYDHKPELLEFGTEFAFLGDVAKINIDNPLKDLQTIKAQFAAMKTNIDAAQKTNDPAFVKEFQPFWETNAPVSESAEKKAVETKAFYIETAMYLGEDETKVKKDPPEEFFNNFKSLGDLALKFKKEEEERKKKEAKAASGKK